MSDPTALSAANRPDAAPEEASAPDERARSQPLLRGRALFLVAAGLMSLILAAGVIAQDINPSQDSDGPRRAAQPITEYTAGERGDPVAIGGRDLTGAPVDTAALRGRPLVLNVWGSWCAPCRTEAPVLRTVSAEYAGRGVRFLGINVKDNPAAATAFERRYDISYASLDDQSGKATLALSRYLPASVVPATLVLDAEGRVAARVLGAVEASTLRALLDAVTAS